MKVDVARFVKVAFISLLLMSSIAPATATATATTTTTTIDELVASNKLTVELRLPDTDTFIAKQPIIIAIEVSTDRWFAKGTRIEGFELEETVIMPMSEFAINGTKRIGGATWASQIREITLYPMKEGIYQLPPIAVSVSVNTEGGAVSGVVYTKAPEFEVVIPKALVGIADYIVSSQFSLDIEGDFDQEQAYKIGNAVTQKITFIAENVPAMMLPVLPLPEIPGVSIYQKPGKINDQKNRGVTTGTRIESLSYIFEQKGEYYLPEQKFYWWNTTTQGLAEVVIPARSWIVSGELAKQNTLTKERGFWTLNKALIIQVIVALILLYFVFRLYSYKTRLITFYERITRKQYKLHRKRFISAVKNQQFQYACQQLYLTVELVEKNKQMNSLRSLKNYYGDNPNANAALDKLFQAAYSGIENSFTIYDANILLIVPNASRKRSEVCSSQGHIQLNPDS